MQLFINDEQVDVQFETEKNLLDVYQSIEAEAARHSRYIIECRVDDREVSGDFLASTAIEGADRIHFLVGDSRAVLLRTARTIDRYLDRVGNALFFSEELHESDLAELRSGVDWMHEFAAAACNLMGLDMAAFTVPMPDGAASHPLARVLASLKTDVAALSPGETGLTMEPVLAGLRALKSFTSRLIVRMDADNLSNDDIHAGLERFAGMLPSLVERIVTVNERYQSGRDEEAVQILDEVMHQLDGLLPYVFGGLERLSAEARLVPAPGLEAIDGKMPAIPTMEDAGAALLALFGDLSAALEEGDVVAAGDILEYELADRIGRLGPFLVELKKLLPADSPTGQP